MSTTGPPMSTTSPLAGNSYVTVAGSVVAGRICRQPLYDPGNGSVAVVMGSVALPAAPITALFVTPDAVEVNVAVDGCSAAHVAARANRGAASWSRHLVTVASTSKAGTRGVRSGRR